MLTFTGIAGPAAVGAIAGTFNLEPKALGWPILIAGVIAVIQVVITIWSLVAGWDASFAYYLESKADNYRLAEEFETLGNTSSMPRPDFETQLQVLEAEGELRTNLDYRFDITDREKRFAMRAGLRRYRRECVACRTVPTNLDSTDCDVCGKY